MARSRPSSAAAPPSRPARAHQDRHQGNRAQRTVLTLTAALGALVVAAAVTSAVLLAKGDLDARWVPVLQNVLNVSFQALALGALGGLAKLYLDGRRDREAQETELRDRRHGYITAVVEASHRVDNARLVLRANRSVRTWSDVVNNDLIPARTRLRQVTHDLRNWSDAHRPVFAASETIADLLEDMYGYLGALVDEYSEDKARLSEIQLVAEGAKGADRATLLTQIWDEMRALRLFGDYIADGELYAGYRDRYLEVLREMRSSLGND